MEVYRQSWRMYSHASTGLPDRAPRDEGAGERRDEKPWRNRCIRPVSLAGSPNLFCPVRWRMVLAHWNSCPYVSASMLALGMYLSTSLLATIT